MCPHIPVSYSFMITLSFHNMPYAFSVSRNVANTIGQYYLSWLSLCQSPWCSSLSEKTLCIGVNQPFISSLYTNRSVTLLSIILHSTAVASFQRFKIGTTTVCFQEVGRVPFFHVVFMRASISCDVKSSNLLKISQLMASFPGAVLSLFFISLHSYSSEKYRLTTSLLYLFTFLPITITSSSNTGIFFSLPDMWLTAAHISPSGVSTSSLQYFPQHSFFFCRLNHFHNLSP